MPENIVGKTVSNVSYSTLIWASGAVIGYVFWLAMGRLLQPADFGLLTTVLAVYNVLGAVVTLSCGDVAVKFLPAYDNTRRQQRDAFMTFMFVAIFIIAISVSTLLYLFAEPLAGALFQDSMMVSGFKILGGLIILGSLYTVFRGCLYSEQKFSRIFRTDLFGGLFKLISGVGLVLAGFSIGGLLGCVAGFGAALALSLLYSSWRPTFNLHVLELGKIRNYITASTAASVLGSVYMQSSTIITGSIAGLTQAGLMGAAVIFSGLLGLAASIIYSAVLPMLSRLWSQNDMPRFTRLLDNAVRYSLLATIPGLLIMWGSGNWIIGSFYSTDYQQANALLVPYFLGLVIATFGGCYIAVPHLGNRPSWRTMALGISAVTNTVLAILTVPLYGAAGAAWGFVAASIVYTACSYVMIRRMGIRPKSHARLLLPAAGLGLVVFLSQGLGQLPGLLTSVLIGLPVYVGLAMMNGSIVKGDAQILRSITVRGMRVPSKVTDIVERWASS